MRTQKTLSSEQVEAFYHDEFVTDQVRQFVHLFEHSADQGMVVDMGGGCGFFARRLAELTNHPVRVIDMDPASVQACRVAGLDAVEGDAVHPTISGDEEIVTFNLILHHLVADSERSTVLLQSRALALWLPYARAVFVNEYIYESLIGNLSGWLIYQITKSRFLSAVGQAVSKLVPSLKANTFGVGVRFRSHKEWRGLFEAAGYTVANSVIGANEPVSMARRFLFIKNIRRDSFLLLPTDRVELPISNGN